MPAFILPVDLVSVRSAHWLWPRKSLAQIVHYASFSNAKQHSFRADLLLETYLPCPIATSRQRLRLLFGIQVLQSRVEVITLSRTNLIPDGGFLHARKSPTALHVERQQHPAPTAFAQVLSSSHLDDVLVSHSSLSG
jgi:hypothetical protein